MSVEFVMSRSAQQHKEEWIVWSEPDHEGTAHSENGVAQFGVERQGNGRGTFGRTDAKRSSGDGSLAYPD